jgi:hypothetical protein
MPSVIKHAVALLPSLASAPNTQASLGTSGRSVNDKAHLHLVSSKTTHRFGSMHAIRIHNARKTETFHSVKLTLAQSTL